MLKVNTAKISVEKFADKYWLTFELIKAVDNVFCYSYEDMGCHLEISKNGFVSIWSEDEGSIEGSVLDVLFDMIKNGDVIKE